MSSPTAHHKHSRISNMSSGGSEYVGAWKDGKRHGHGTMTWDDGHEYVGVWNHGEPVAQAIAAQLGVQGVSNLFLQQLLNPANWLQTANAEKKVTETGLVLN